MTKPQVWISSDEVWGLVRREAARRLACAEAEVDLDIEYDYGSWWEGEHPPDRSFAGYTARVAKKQENR